MPIEVFFAREVVKKRTPRLRELAPATRRSRDTGSHNIGPIFLTTLYCFLDLIYFLGHPRSIPGRQGGTKSKWVINILVGRCLRVGGRASERWLPMTIIELGNLDRTLSSSQGRTSVDRWQNLIKFCSVAKRSHSPWSPKAKHIQSKNFSIAIWQPWAEPDLICSEKKELDEMRLKCHEPHPYLDVENWKSMRRNNLTLSSSEK